MPIRPFSRCQVEKAKPELLQPALTDAMSHFVSEVQDGLAPSSPNRRIAMQHTAAASRRNLELGTSGQAQDAGGFAPLPDRWMLIWTMLISDPDDAMRGVARQARQNLGGPAPKPSYAQPPVRSAALFSHCAVPHATPPPRAVAGLC